jgi:hypothetical protein
MEQVKITKKAVKTLFGKPIGKISYVLPRPQAVQWVKDPQPLKMLTLYLSAKDYLVESGIDEKLVELSAKHLGNIQGKPLTPKLHESVMFTACPWHMRAVRVFKLLKEEFENGRSVESYGSASGIIEILALIMSGNRSVKLTLIDYDEVGIDLARKLVELFDKHDYDIGGQVEIKQGDIRDCVPKAETNTVISIGLVHNYFTLSEANGMLQSWFDKGATKVITDIYHDAEIVDDGYNDAKLRIAFVKNVLSWKFGLSKNPNEPNGLLFCSKESFAESLPEYQIKAYDHSLNATMVVASP